MADKLEVRIITPDHVTFSRTDADSISIPGMMGDMVVLPGHVPTFSTIKPGTVIIKAGEAQATFAVGTGFLEVNANVVKVLVDSADGNAGIDPDVEKRFIEEAEDKLKSIDATDVETRFAWETKLATAKARIEVFENVSNDADPAKNFSTFVEPIKPDSTSH